MTPVLKRQVGVWLGWPGTREKIDINNIIDSSGVKLGYSIKPVWLDETDINQYYLGFSNEVLWPLFHDIQTGCNFSPSYWDTYRAVNKKFARQIADIVEKNDYIWVHDYHLIMVAYELRMLGIKNNTGFFLHIPFPSPDMYMKLPWRMDILRAMLEYNLIGFQTMRDRNNFVHCVDKLIKGHSADIRRNIAVLRTAGKRTKVGSFPISIDFNDFARKAGTHRVSDKARRLRLASPNRKIILGLDRLDYSKGIPERLRAVGNALERYQCLVGKITMVQVVIPSREEVPGYSTLRDEIERIASKVNGKYTQPGWVPIHYMYRSLERDELLAYYRAAHIALITPLKDGMNLVSKEYCAAQIDNNGVLVLSEFAGAASQLSRNCLVVNPYDIQGIADQIYTACTMNEEERQLRMRRLRNMIAKRDIYWWLESFMQAASESGN